jgi:hypothetical protein
MMPLSGLLFAIPPAFRTSRVDLVTSLKVGTAGSGDGRSRLRTGLVVATVDVGFQGYDDGQGRRLLDDLEQRVKGILGVEHAALGYMLPFAMAAGTRGSLPRMRPRHQRIRASSQTSTP